MSLFGFREDKSKEEIYSKEELDAWGLLKHITIDDLSLKSSSSSGYDATDLMKSLTTASCDKIKNKLYPLMSNKTPIFGIVERFDYSTGPFELNNYECMVKYISMYAAAVPAAGTSLEMIIKMHDTLWASGGGRITLHIFYV